MSDVLCCTMNIDLSPDINVRTQYQETVLWNVLSMIWRIKEHQCITKIWKYQ